MITILKNIKIDEGVLAILVEQWAKSKNTKQYQINHTEIAS